jgi:type I restriction enzyme S subunit
MSFPPYHSYRKTDFNWIGVIPEHWSIQKFRHLFEESSEKIESEAFGDMLSVSGYRGIELKQYDDENRRRRDEDLVGYRIVRRGQLVVNTMWLNYAGLGFSDLDGHVSPAYRAYWKRTDENTKYLHYLLRSEHYVKGYTRLLTGVRPNSLQMSRDNMMSFPVILPPQEEQLAIATFLDRETAKIDALIAEQQRLIGLLHEKRQAVISHAVTKGLNPYAPKKDSGVEWLGEVPEHWRILPVWILFALGRGRVISHQDIADNPGEYPVYSSQTEDNGEMGRIDTFDFDGDFLTWTTDGANAGSVFKREGRFNCTNVCGTLKAKSCTEISLDYALFSLQLATSSFVRMDINPKLMNNVMASIKLPVPPLGEQIQIVDHLLTETGSFEPLKQAIGIQLKLLSERGSALISAAVTGQIDVRGLVPAEADP